MTITSTNLEIINGYRVCEENCNGILNTLYGQRDNMSRRIDKLIELGYATDETEQKYNAICETIGLICNYRSNHNCRLIGDPDFRYC